jgi:peptidoglycan glycosyltransferase
MNSMSVTIRRLTMTFIVFLLAVSAVAAYVQVSNQAFFAGPTLAQGVYDPRDCPPYDAPLRGTIYDRTGIPLAWSWPDPNAKACGYTRSYNKDAVNAGLGPLLGYFSYKYGVGGLESAYNEYLAGIGKGTSPDDVQNKILHKPRYGNDLYLAIDLRLQQKANQYYDSSAFYKHSAGSPCQPTSTAPGGLVVEDPGTGEILALVSRPSYDPNRISGEDAAYWQQLNTDPNVPLYDHATQGLYVPGSTFKTLTMIADLDSTGADLTAKTYDQAAATHFQPFGTGHDVEWVDYTRNGEWQGIPNLFPMSLQDGFAYSDNTIFARAAIDVGKDKWLSYAQKFGIAVPGADVPPVPFDAPYNQSSVYPQFINGKPTDFDKNLLADSGFGQGDLLISPLTMAEITSAIATGGKLFDPHVVRTVAAHSDNPATSANPPKSLTPPAPDPDRIQEYQNKYWTSGQIFQRGDTAAKLRQAMWAVTSYGTGVLSRSGVALADQAIKVGGKTGTGEDANGGVKTTWWISLAPVNPNDFTFQSPHQLITVLEKDKAGEGACQVYVAYDTYEAARQLGYLKV